MRCGAGRSAPGRVNNATLAPRGVAPNPSRELRRMTQRCQAHQGGGAHGPRSRERADRGRRSRAMRGAGAGPGCRDVTGTRRRIRRMGWHAEHVSGGVRLSFRDVIVGGERRRWHQRRGRIRRLAAVTAVPIARLDAAVRLRRHRARRGALGGCTRSVLWCRDPARAPVKCADAGGELGPPVSGLVVARFRPTIIR